MSTKKKLLFFVFPINFFLSHRLPIALGAIKIGYEVHLISSDDAEKEMLKKHGIFFHPIKISRSKANPINEIATIIQLRKLYNNIQPDIVHHITIKPILYGTLVARICRIKAVVNAFSGLGYVFTAKGLVASLRRNCVILAYRLILKHKNLISIVQNNDDLNYLNSKSIICRNQTVLIRGSGVNLNEFRPTDEPSGVPIVILPARILKDKGVIEYVEAAQLLKYKNIAVRMVLAGAIDHGNPSALTYEEITDWTDKKIIEYWGHCKDMSSILQKVNIVCLPSYREGLPKTLIEAAASARAIVTTDVPGCREMIDTDNLNGILVPPFDAIAISEAIEELISFPTRRFAMAKNNRKLAERFFSIDQIVEKTLKIYAKLIK